MSEARLRGRIVKALGGFYYVQTDQSVVECRARGTFRRDKVTPYVGDWVEIECSSPESGYVLVIELRKNELIRPPLANLDQLILVLSTCEPAPNFPVADKMIAIAEYKKIEPIVVVTKQDRCDGSEIVDLYRRCGFQAVLVSSETGEGIEEIRALLAGKLSAFSGNSGVGKSSLLNRIDGRLSIRTAEISQKLGRGRHTTTHVELFELPGGGYVADTPGFSTVDLQRFEVILKDQRQYCFREFEPFLNDCKYTGCSHTTEQGCAVLQAVADGRIPQSRHRSYLQFYSEVKELREWQVRPQGTADR